MGPLTESMTRLCGEIVTLRGARLNFVRDLGQDVAAMKRGFRRAHAEMAQRTKADRQGFVKALGHEVASLGAGFRRAHREMGRKGKAERQAAVRHLKHIVGAMRREFALDLAGAHRIWFGPSPAELKAKAEAARRAKAEAERRVQEAAERQRQAAAARAREAAAPKSAPQGKTEAGRPEKKKV
jgi:hypothetical protein